MSYIKKYVYGQMGAGKSRALITKFDIARDYGYSVALFSGMNDLVESRDGTRRFPATLEELHECTADIILIDEAQFLLTSDLRHLTCYPGDVFLYGLTVDFTGKPFTNFTYVSTHPTWKTEKIRSVCEVAGCTAEAVQPLLRIHGDVVTSGPAYVPMDTPNTFYQSVCHRHYLEATQ